MVTRGYRKYNATTDTSSIGILSRIGSQLPTLNGKHTWTNSKPPGHGLGQIPTEMLALISRIGYCDHTDMPCLQVVLEGVEYESFNVPECPSCLLEDRRNSIVNAVPLPIYTSRYSSIHAAIAQTRINFLRGVDPTRSTRTIVSAHISKVTYHWLTSALDT